MQVEIEAKKSRLLVSISSLVNTFNYLNIYINNNL